MLIFWQAQWDGIVWIREIPEYQHFILKIILKNSGEIIANF
jgi:hypothetical protein